MFNDVGGGGRGRFAITDLLNLPNLVIYWYTKSIDLLMNWLHYIKLYNIYHIALHYITLGILGISLIFIYMSGGVSKHSTMFHDVGGGRGRYTITDLLNLPNLVIFWYTKSLYLLMNWLHYTTLHYITLNYITFITLHYIKLHYIT